MKRILINATQKEELRVAMVNGQKLYDLDIEVPSREQKKSNIYKAKITRIEPSLEAVFVNYGAERHGFLPFKEIAREYIDESAKDDKGRYNIKDAIKVNQEIIVQVEKEERGNKGAALTTFISLAGRFLVAMPQNSKSGGVSRRIEGEDRDQVRKVLSELNMPEGMGVIVRTAGVGRSTEEMQWDLDTLAQVWEAIAKASEDRSAPFLIYQESDIVVRALRDHYKSDVGEIIIDSKKFFDRAHDFMSMVMPNALHKLKLFEEKLPLFNRFQIESQIETAFSREVNLPSGGAIVIDHTEALISIDVNSARATKGSDIEATAKNTNLEAADEIARQLRIRDLGGLVVIDFIDMLQNKNQREVEQRLRNAVYEDRARVQTTRISRFGLMEMSRQRLRPSLGESSQIVCPRCDGQGTIRDVESLSLAVLRLLEEEALKDNTGRILVKIPVDCATYLLNEKRTKIAALEDRHNVHAVIIPDPKLETPHFELERVRGTDTHRHESNYKNSYELTTEDTSSAYNPLDKKKAHHSEQAAVQRISPPMPKPPAAAPEKPKETSSPGFIAKIFTSLFGFDGKNKNEEKESEQKSTEENNKTRRPQNRGGRRNQYRNNQNRNNNRNKNTSNNNDAKNAQTGDKKPNNNEQKKASQVGQENKPRNNRNRNRNRKPSNKNTNPQNENQQTDGNNQATNEQNKSERPARKPHNKNSAQKDKANAVENKGQDEKPKNSNAPVNKPQDDKPANAAENKKRTQPPVEKKTEKTESVKPTEKTETAPSAKPAKSAESKPKKSETKPASTADKKPDSAPKPPRKKPEAKKPAEKKPTTNSEKPVSENASANKEKAAPAASKTETSTEKKD